MEILRNREYNRALYQFDEVNFTSFPIKINKMKVKNNIGNNDIPRRNRLDLMTPSEMAIHIAILEVEKVGADVKLTNAVVLLDKAKGLVADYIDAPELENDDIHYWKCPECGDFISTSKKTPQWLIEQIKVYHLHKEMQTPCRGVYVEITKDKFWKLSENQQ